MKTKTNVKAGYAAALVSIAKPIATPVTKPVLTGF